MYEVLNNLVVEMTRLAIDMKNHRMRVESVAARLDFDERRARALEQIVQFRTPSASGNSAPRPTARQHRERQRGERRRGETPPPAAARTAPCRKQHRCGRRPDDRSSGSERTDARLGIERRRRRAGSRRRTPFRHGARTGRRYIRTVKLAVVVQRYGADINGGAELHCALRRRAPLPSRRDRGADDLRPGLHHLAQ